MTRRLKQWSALVFLVTALTAADPMPVQAADCWSFMNNCNVTASWPFFVFDCGPGVSCGDVGACLEEACPGGVGECFSESCEPNGGPCGWGYCPG